MNNDFIDKLITEDVLKSSGFINIDKKDIENLKMKSTFIDGIKSTGHPSELIDMIETAVTKIEDEHKQTSKCALLVIKQPVESELRMEDVTSISEVFSEKDNYDYVWGISTDDNLTSGDISIIVLLGF